jgi:hypothetical protein
MNSLPRSITTVVGLGYLFSHFCSSVSITTSAVFAGTSASSNHPVTGSIMVRQFSVKSCNTQISHGFPSGTPTSDSLGTPLVFPYGTTRGTTTRVTTHQTGALVDHPRPLMSRLKLDREGSTPAPTTPTLFTLYHCIFSRIFTRRYRRLLQC